MSGICVSGVGLCGGRACPVFLLLVRHAAYSPQTGVNWPGFKKGNTSRVSPHRHQLSFKRTSIWTPAGLTTSMRHLTALVLAFTVIGEFVVLSSQRRLRFRSNLWFLGSSSGRMNTRLFLNNDGAPKSPFLKLVVEFEPSASWTCPYPSNLAITFLKLFNVHQWWWRDNFFLAELESA